MYLRLLMLLSVFTFTSCQEGTPLEKGDTTNPVYLAETHLGPGYLDIVNNADTVSLIKVQPKMPRDYELEDKSVEMDHGDVAKLKDVLLNDDSYIFDLQKHCVFLPEYALKFKARDKVLLLLYSPTCKEFKIPYGQFKAQIIEIDPSFEQIEKLISKYKTQLEVNDEN